MAILNSSAVQYESGQTPFAFAALTPNAARLVYSTTTRPWSAAAGYEYVTAPYGLLTGGAVTPATANNQVDVAALTAMMPAATGADATTGILTVGAAAGTAVTRGSAGNICLISSITVSASGSIAVVAGSPHTAFSETRGGLGGPPSIPLGSIEIAQVRLGSITAAAVLPSEIFAVPGTHQERSDFPVYNVDPIRGTLTFAAALPLIHGATATAASTAGKLVYVRGALPIFAEIPRSRNWVPGEETASATSEQYYDGIVGSYTTSLNTASWEGSLNDGITDAIVTKKGQVLYFRFYPDKNKLPHQITQGYLTVSRTNTAGANPTATFTVTPTQSTVDFAS